MFIYPPNTTQKNYLEPDRPPPHGPGWYVYVLRRPPSTLVRPLLIGPLLGISLFLRAKKCP